jgi:uncharacterized protein YceH (UPF0502 family)
MAPVFITTPLTAIEVRALGCLVEKAATTPEYYPLTLNALTTACNQTSNRNPVMHVSDSEVQEAVLALREKKLARTVVTPGGRGPKNKHVLEEALELSAADVAALGVLMLRGPQTVGEIKGRSERLHNFRDLAEVEGVLEGLAGRVQPLVVRLERQPGHKEERWAHLLSGAPDLTALTALAYDGGGASARGDGGGGGGTPRADRVAALETEVAQLRSDLAALQEAFEAFRRAFE